MLGCLYSPELGGGEERTDDLPEVARVRLLCLLFRDEPKDVVFADGRTDASTKGTGPFAIALAIQMLFQELAHCIVLKRIFNFVNRVVAVELVTGELFQSEGGDFAGFIWYLMVTNGRTGCSATHVIIGEMQHRLCP